MFENPAGIDPARAENENTPTMAKPTVTERKRKRRVRHSSAPYRYAGGWRIQFTAGGRRIGRTFPTKRYGERAYQEAVDALARIRGEQQRVRDGFASAPVAPPTFKRFCEDQYVPNRAAMRRSGNSIDSVLKVWLYPHFGELRLNQITLERIDKLRADMRDAGRKPATISNALVVLNAALNYAVELSLILTKPRIHKPKIPQQDYKYLREKQWRGFLVAARKKGEDVFVAYSLALYAGLRVGEICGLRWLDVDLKNNLIFVCRSYDHETTKSGKVRHVPILAPLKPVLKVWRLRSPGELVVPTSVDTMRQAADRMFQETFHDVLTAAKLPKMRFHDLRHSYASALVARGVDLYRVQKLLGHAGPQMTQRYSHLSPDQFADLRGVFGNKPPASKPAIVQQIGDAKRRRKRQAK